MKIYARFLWHAALEWFYAENIVVESIAAIACLHCNLLRYHSIFFGGRGQNFTFDVLAVWQLQPKVVQTV